MAEKVEDKGSIGGFSCQKKSLSREAEEEEAVEEEPEEDGLLYDRKI